jgi:hypothetical protein
MGRGGVRKNKATAYNQGSARTPTQGWECSTVLQNLPSIYMALSLIPSTGGCRDKERPPKANS